MKRAKVTEEVAYGTALDRLISTDRPAQIPPEGEPSEQPKIPMIKLSVFLNREEDTYLETLASAAKFSGGKKISRRSSLRPWSGLSALPNWMLEGSRLMRNS